MTFFIMIRQVIEKVKLKLAKSVQLISMEILILEGLKVTETLLKFERLKGKSQGQNYYDNNNI